MTGQGGPSTSHPPAGWKLRAAKGKLRRRLLRVCAYAAAFGLVASNALAGSAAENLRLRIEWGRGAARQWQGAIRLDRGTLSDVVVLGSAADQAGNYVASGNTLVIRQRSPRSLDGLAFTATAPLDARLTVAMHAVGDQNAPPPLELKLSDLVTGRMQSPLDGAGNHVVVERAPGDSLRVVLVRSSLIFEPEETFEFRIVPYELGVEAGTAIKLRVSIEEARGGGEIWNQEFDVTATEGSYSPANLPMALKLPAEEGVYDVRISARRWGLRERLDPTRRIAGGTPVAERLVQCVVLGKQSPPREPPSQAPWKNIVELDTANPRWWQRFTQLPQVTRLPGLPKGPWDSGNVIRGGHSTLKAAVQLPPQAWQALPLAVEHIGAPHILEVDYPSDAVQTLGISLIEPDAAGEVFAPGLDSGVVCHRPDRSQPAKWLTHRLIFWPRTKTPIVLLANRDETRPAVHGKIRVLAGPARLPAAESLAESRPRRRLLGYFDRPLFAENFGASEAKDIVSGRSLDDWVTFYEGATRLADYLRHAGYGGVMLSVYTDGSTIYPSALVEPSLRYDTGGLFSTGQDPIRKDVLELLLRIFEREGLVLVPAVHFSAPLPELETALMQGGPETIGVELIGSDGRPWSTVVPSPSGVAPYYNPLHPLTQRAMSGVARELLNRYAHHPSFHGLALALDSEGFATFPAAAWGLDDWTTSSFARDRQIRLDLKRGDRFVARTEALLGDHREAWLTWRANKLGEFYRRLAAESAQACPDSKLYLAGAGLFSSWSEPRRLLQPNLNQMPAADQALLEVGIDVAQLASATELGWLRPVRISAGCDSHSLAADVSLRHASELDRHSASGFGGAQFLHVPAPVRLTAFDEKSPFGKGKSLRWLSHQFVPSADEQRLRYVEALAVHDAPVIFDGGWMLSMGQEAATANWIEAYRQLPAARFATLADVMPPVTVRYAVDEGETYTYLVNNSPWPLEVSLRVDAPANCQVQNLAPRREVGLLVRGAMGTMWSVRLEPYDLVAAKFSAATVRFSSPEVQFPAEAEAELTRRMEDLESRLRQLDNPPGWDTLINPGFELPVKVGQIPGWHLTRQPQVAVEVTGQAPASGRQSATIASDGPVASLVSEWFAAPRTGRLDIELSLRTNNAASQPPLRVGIQARPAGSTNPRHWEYRFLPVGAAPAATQLRGQWGRFIVPFEDVPAAAGTEIQVRFDLMGAGNVHIDDVQLAHLRFTGIEKVALSKIVTLASARLRGGRLADCARLLDGYWPQFLLEHVPPAQLAAQRNPRTNAADEPRDKPESPGMLDRLKKLKPF